MHTKITSEKHSAKRVLRRTLPAALVLLAIFLVFTVPAGATGIDITGSTASGTDWSYDAGTLTLNGGTWDYINVTGVSDLTIVLNGKNTISGGNSITESSYQMRYGIYVAGNLTIQDGGSGSGSLTVSGVTATSTSSDADAYGLAADTISISSGSVTVSDVTATSTSTSSSYSAEAFGLYADTDITVSGGSVEVSSVTATSTSTSGDAYAYGFYADNDITVSGGSVTVSGVVATSTSAYASGLIAGTITIESGSVTVSSVTATSDSDSAKAFGLIAASYSAGTISISDGSVKVSSVTATSTSSDADAYGLATAADTISISSGSVEVDGVSATSDSDNADAYGLYTGTITIESGSVTVSSVTAESTSTSSSDNAEAYGLFAGIITIESGSVTVSGVTAESDSSDAYGLYAGTISITGGQTLATGSTQALYVSATSPIFTVVNSLGIWAATEMDPTALTKIENTNANDVIDSTKGYKYVFITTDTEDTTLSLHTVTYNGNGGTGTVPDPQKYPEGMMLTVADAVEKTGSSFEGWNASSDSHIYQSGDSFTMPSADVIFTAQWEGGTPDDTTPDDNDSDDNDSDDNTPDDNTPDDNNQNNSAPGIVDTSSSGSAVDTGSGKYSEYPRTVKDGGSVSFGTSPVAAEVILPKGSTGSVVLKVASIEDWPGKEKTPYAFDISAPDKAEGVAQIIFKIKLSELERLEVLPKDVGTFHNVGEEWVQLKTVYEIKDEYVWYTAETDSFSPFEIRFVEDGTVPKDSAEPVAPVVPETPETPVTPDEPEILPPIDPVVPETPEQPESPTPILAVLAGLGAAVVLRRK